MLGVLVTFLFALLCVPLGQRILGKRTAELDPAERFGLCGVIGLGACGVATLFLGLVSGGLKFNLILVVLVVNAALSWRSVKEFKLKLPKNIFAPFALFVLVLMALIGVLAPPNMMDWDSLAYHLAVPKLWLNQGSVGFVEAIHHSNFPFTADMLYVWGLQWGGSSGAKAFSLCWALYGCCALFGLARRWYPTDGGKSPWWAAIAFLACPVVLWESGTAYIDIPHGLACGLGILYFAESLTSKENQNWLLSGICLGLAMGTKHTGLQILGACVLVGMVAALVTKRQAERPWRGIGLAALLAIAIASPWYLKSIAYTGNPVYPFFYKQLGGKEWDTWRSEIYTREQKSFGVGTSPVNLGHAVLGLAYQPGRYVNPMQDQGRGFPTGGIGPVAFVVAFLWACSGQATRREKLVLATLGVSLLAWFVLSQQSRYLTAIVAPMAVLGVGAVARLRMGRILPFVIGAQAVYSAWMLAIMQTAEQLKVVTGAMTADEYQTQAVGFYAPAKAINELAGQVKVALYDELFGYFLDKPYMWANPGHSTLIPVEKSETGDDYADAMIELGFTHAYVNLQMMDSKARARWIEAMGLAGEGAAYSDGERAEVRSNPDLWWRVLFAEAVRSGRLKVVQTFPVGQQPRSVLFEFTR